MTNPTSFQSHSFSGCRKKNDDSNICPQLQTNQLTPKQSRYENYQTPEYVNLVFQNTRQAFEQSQRKQSRTVNEKRRSITFEADEHNQSLPFRPRQVKRIRLEEVRNSSQIEKERLVLLNVRESFDNSSFGYLTNGTDVSSSSGLATMITGTIPSVSVRNESELREYDVGPGERPRPLCLSVFGKPAPFVSVIRGAHVRVPFSWTNGSRCLQVEDSLAPYEESVVYSVVASNCFGNSTISFSVEVRGGGDSDEELFPWWAAVVVSIGCGVLGTFILCLVCCVCHRKSQGHLKVKESNGTTSCNNNNNNNNPDDRQYIEMNPSNVSPSPRRHSKALRPNSKALPPNSSHTLPVRPYATVRITAADPVYLGSPAVGSGNGTVTHVNDASDNEYEVMATVSKKSKNDSQYERGCAAVSKRASDLNQ
ncbi:uncharacterized protein LOC134177595 [Corticium candelabrum]|uniref:uncharacterized protein LOC134177595 n=1 Tax=Corticium candelabrum TaxID=121492 RepID=UPI002E25D39C|nr:uncharacterized protein LOC134177595 [Corticium candelabrum]